MVGDVRWVSARGRTYPSPKSSAVTVSLTREQNQPNKFAEAAALAERFPDLAAWLPRRPKLWEREPRNLVYFEALALAVQSGFIANDR